MLAAAGYGVYRYMTLRQAGGQGPAISQSMVIRQTEGKSRDLLNVLGATTQQIFTQGTAALNEATDGRAEPVINKAVSDLQEKVKDLPEEQYKRVKYEFCKDVVASPSPASSI